MIYYFYSEKRDIKGLLNCKRMKISLFDDVQQAVSFAEKHCGLNSENPVGYIYKCTVIDMKEGESLNSRYKSEVPVQVSGCVKVGDLL